jgi:hypothetical protein
MKSVYYRVKRLLKRFRLLLRRRLAMIRWGKEAVQKAPAVFGNAMPKAGSHLLLQILYGLAEIGPFYKPGFPPVNRFEDNSHLSEAEILKEIKSMRSGEIRFGYISHRKPFLDPLLDDNLAHIFIYRDPRDLLVSHVFYALNIHEGHAMHEYYNQELDTMEERLNVAIEGCDLPGLELPNVRERYQNNLEWLEEDRVLSVRFEDLILNRDQTLSDILEYIESYGVSFSVERELAVRVMRRAIQPKKSGTFRKGQPGNWQDHFTTENKQKFKATAGDLLVRLGYEKSNQDW